MSFPELNNKTHTYVCEKLKAS